MQTTEAQERYYKIGDLMRLFRLSRGTLNHYINIGLIRPSRKDESSGHRVFDEDTLERLRRIETLKEQNPKLSLVQIRDIIDNELPL